VAGLNREVLDQIALSDQVTGQQKTVATAIQKIASRRAPKRTGRMAKGIRVEESVDEQTRLPEYRVGWDKKTAWYGPLEELGTEDTEPRPHLRPAADEVSNS
jgi:HK97 gp10 family phage protein